MFILDFLIYYVIMTCLIVLPFYTKRIKRNDKLLICTATLSIILLSFILSPLEIYDRRVNFSLIIILYISYCIIWGLSIKMLDNDSVDSSIYYTFLISPIIFVTFFCLLSFIFPILFIIYDSSTTLTQKIDLNKSYTIENYHTGTISSNSYREVRFYKIIIPKILKYKYDQFRFNEFEYGTLTIDTTEWITNRKVTLLGKNRVLHTFNMSKQ